MNSAERRARFEAVAPAVIDAVRRYLVRRTDPATADDVLSETLLTCWRRFDEMPGSDQTHPRWEVERLAAEQVPWAYGIARLCLANAERGRRRRARLIVRIGMLDPPRSVTGPPALPDDELGAALAALRPEDAELLRLWAWEDLAPAQIAVALGISANAAHIRLHRAKQRLRDRLRKTSELSGHEQPTEGRRS